LLIDDNDRNIKNWRSWYWSMHNCNDSWTSSNLIIIKMHQYQSHDQHHLWFVLENKLWMGWSSSTNRFLFSYSSILLSEIRKGFMLLGVLLSIYEEMMRTKKWNHSSFMTRSIQYCRLNSSMSVCPLRKLQM
jgi:hypothetical protein